MKKQTIRSNVNQLVGEARSSLGLKQWIFTISGDFLAAGFSAVALIIFSRILGPAKFGEFSIGVAIVLILARFGDSGFSAALLKLSGRNPDKRSFRQLFSLTLYYKTFFCLVIATAGIVFQSQIAQILGFTHPELIVTAFVLSSAFVFYDHLLVALQSLHLFTRAVFINLIQAFAKMAAAIGLLLVQSSSSFWSLFLYLLGPYLPVLILKWLLPSWFRLEKNIPWKLNVSALEVAKHSSIAFIAAGIIENIDILFISRYLSTYEAGLYSGVMRISLVLSLIAFSLGNVLNSRVARYKKQSDRKAFMKKAVLIGLISLGGFVLFVPLASFLILLTIGPEYLSGVKELIILGASSFIWIISVPWIALFYSFKSNWYFSVSGIIQLLIVIIGDIVLVPMFGLEAAAWVRLGDRAFVMVFSILLALWLYRQENKRRTS